MMRRWILLVLVLLAALPVRAQEATPDAADTLTQAAEAARDAANQGAGALSVVNNAANAVNTTNLLLSLMVGALAVAGIMVGLLAILGAQAIYKTLRDMQTDVGRARGEIGDMLLGLRENTEHMRAQSNRAVQALSMMQLGEQQLERGNLNGALQLYLGAYELDPDNHATNYFLGELYLQSGQIDQGIAHLRDALAADYTHAAAEAALGRALFLQAGRAPTVDEQDLLYVQAEGRFLRALEIDPTALDISGRPIQAALADLYIQQGRMEKARQHVEEARRIAPGSV
jgi:tetratricopeptide (TPR) repeat protein